MGRVAPGSWVFALCGVGLSLLLSACQTSASCNRLQGSVDQFLDLDFDRVVIVRQGFDVAIQYQRTSRTSGENPEKTMILTMDAEGMDQQTGVRFRLSEVQGEISRNVLDNTQFPQTIADMPLATIEFDTFPLEGQEAEGRARMRMAVSQGQQETTLEADFCGAVQ